MLNFFEEQTSNQVDASVIWLHGLGASGSDFRGITESLQLKKTSNIRFIFPDAPNKKITINSNQVMQAWYDITGTEFTDRQDEQGIKKSEQQISELIYNEHRRGVQFNRIIIAGFSQGCAMALYTGLKFPERLGGVIALSGYLPLDKEFKKNSFKINLSTPIFFGHGILDEVVKLKWAKDSHRLLADLGHITNWNEYKMDHSLCNDEINDISFFIKKTLELTG